MFTRCLKVYVLTIGFVLLLFIGCISAFAVDYVPYTGATDDINLGVHNLSTTGAVTIGGADDVVQFTVKPKINQVGNQPYTTPFFEIYGTKSVDQRIFMISTIGFLQVAPDQMNEWLINIADSFNDMTDAAPFISGGMIGASDGLIGMQQTDTYSALSLVRHSANQEHNIQEWQTEDLTVLASVDKNGNASFPNVPQIITGDGAPTSTP
jgi:hypothetical protein